jgi:hypothetical protein
VEMVLLPSPCLPPRVAVPRVERWGVGTPRKTQGSGKGRSWLPPICGLPNDARAQLPRGLATQGKRGVFRGDWGSQMSPYRLEVRRQGLGKLGVK